MATTEELLIEQKKLQATIAASLKVDVTKTTAAQRIKSQKATAAARARLTEVNRQLSGKPKTPPKSDSKAPLPTGPKIAENAPPGITTDILNDLAATIPGFDASSAGTWQQGGLGTTGFVYTGEVNKPGGLVMKGGKPVSTVIPTLVATTTMTNNFWTDAALQKKIIGAYAAKGKTIGQVEAFGVWSQLVNTAASIYQGGRGAKVTPLQLLTDSLKSVKGDEPTLPTRAISKLDKGIFNQFMDRLAQSELGMALTQATKDKYYDEFNKLNTGTLTEYKKVKNPKTGKLENVQTTTPGFTEADMTRAASDKLKKDNPKQWELNKSLSFASDLRSVMAGGI
jgi:hypothetical protein